MTRSLTTAILLTALVPPSAPSSDSPMLLADLAWERGDYAAALSDYLQLLESADESAVEAIALKTGELYHVTEATTDGGVPQFSPDDRHFIYESGTGSRRRTHLAATAEPTRPILELRGWGAAFSPDGANSPTCVRPSPRRSHRRRRPSTQRRRPSAPSA
jgi:hypothetical protein